ncbi:MAG: hypothetical protein R3Y29_07040 [bacterium]
MLEQSARAIYYLADEEEVYRMFGGYFSALLYIGVVGFLQNERVIF